MFYICTKFLNNRHFRILKMKKDLSLILVAVFCSLAFFKAQKHEIGVQLGMSNLVGDIGRTNYVLQKPIGNVSDFGLPFYGGIMYRMNFNPYQTVRFNFGINHIQFDDHLATEQYRRNRQLYGTNSVLSADVLFEYNFLPVNNEQKSMLSPYIFAGISGLYMDGVSANLNIESLNDVEINYKSNKKMTMAIPFGIGLKYKFNYNWALSGEFTFRPTFSNQVDYSEIKEKDVRVKSNLDKEDTDMIVQQFLRQRNVGNLNSKDWINSATIILSYAFGRPPCYCK